MIFEEYFVPVDLGLLLPSISVNITSIEILLLKEPPVNLLENMYLFDHLHVPLIKNRQNKIFLETHYIRVLRSDAHEVAL